MKKEQKRKAEGFVRLLEELHTALHRALKIQDQETTKELLEKCQRAAIALGTLIEGAEGQGLETVLLVEQYCELAYQIYEEVRQDPGEVSGDKAYNGLAKQLIRIRNGLKT